MLIEITGMESREKELLREDNGNLYGYVTDYQEEIIYILF